MSDYLRALAATDGKNVEHLEKGSHTESVAIKQYIELFMRYEASRLEGEVTRLYAEDAYYRDTFAELNTAGEIEAYFVRSARSVDECVFDIQDVAEHNGNYYFRWTMSLRLARYKDQAADMSVGMSHVRFNRDGRIIFQQDYWDAENVYKHAPDSGRAGRFAKKYMEG